MGLRLRDLGWQAGAAATGTAAWNAEDIDFMARTLLLLGGGGAAKLRTLARTDDAGGRGRTGGYARRIRRGRARSNVFGSRKLGRRFLERFDVVSLFPFCAGTGSQ